MQHTHQENATLRQRLKILTRPFHDELENNTLAMALASGAATPEQYGSYLQRLAPLHEALEARFEHFDAFSEIGIDTSKRRRYPLLQADLDALNLRALPLKAPLVLNFEWRFPFALGVMYVLEGSTMGGRLLSQRLAHINGNDALPVTRYFHAYGDATMGLWGAFCEAIEHFETRNPQDASEVLLGATAMFLTMRDVMHGND